MRTMRVLGLVAAGLVLGGATLAAGCFSYQNDCRYTLECSPSTTDGGSDGSLPPGCDPVTATGPVDPTCGVFVSPSGDDTNLGTQDKPLKTLGAAVALGSTIYACAGTSPFTETLVIDKAVSLFGALDCTKWVYDPSKKTQLTAAADAVPLTLSNKAGGTAVHDFAITALDATMAGGSSIAVVDDQSQLSLVGVDVVAGKGAAGVAAAAPPGPAMTPAAADGKAGTPDGTCNVPGSIGGGIPGVNMCNGVDTSGGVGGQGVAAMSGGTGNGGNPTTMPSNGGVGQTNAPCGVGQPGAQGSPGAPGAGAHGIGDVSKAGYQGPLATMGGGAGTPGQGGGGGGGAKQCAATFSGPSGGGGGAGGCPGAPGVVGTSGGSSIGILALAAKPTLTKVSITTRVGGAGGAGGDGQLGSNGGLPGAAGGSGACGGGNGGQGGTGGPGGGGAGGHSVAVAVKGGMLPDLKGVTITPGGGGAGGPGGNMGMAPQTKGSDGLACKTLDFTNPMSPMACVM